MRAVLVDKRISKECERSLEKYGFFVIPMPAASGLPSPLASHPDMLVAKLGDDIITTADYVEEAPQVFSDIREYAPHIKIHVTDEKFGEEYPKDAIFNSLTLGKKAFLKKSSASPALIKLAEALGYEIVNTRQGYPACTVLPLSKRDAITADRGLAITLGEWGVSVTLIENGDISLPPYEYGFIGGASGVFGDTVYFLGNLATHKNADRILKKIESLGMRAVSLAQHPLSDLGRLIFL